MTAAETTEIAVRPANSITRADEEWSVGQMVEQARKIQECMKAVMVRDEHYGVIPGTGGRDGKPPKPTLLKPGAEKLCLMFRLCPEYETMRAEASSSLIAYTIRCTLTHIPSGNRVATGLGSCNSREKKYTRPADKKCPNCGKETIIKGKEEYGGGWLCFAKKGGCNAKFKDGDETIEKQDNGIADPSDLDNTILKMACKRALVAAVLNGTAASDCFTQDLEDLTSKAAEYTPPAPEEHPADVQARATYRQALQDTPGAVASKPASPPSTHAAPSSASPSRGETKKRNDTGARDIMHDGRLATPEQVKLIHVLRSKIPTWDPKSDDAKSKWADTLAVYPKQPTGPCAVCKATGHGKKGTDPESDCKACKGRGQMCPPVEHSNELSEEQADHLLDRLRARVDKLGAMEREIRNGTDRHAEPPPPPPVVTPADLLEELHAQFPSAAEEDAWLYDTGKWSSADDIPEGSREMVILLLKSLKRGPSAYATELTKARALGHIT